MITIFAQLIKYDDLSLTKINAGRIHQSNEFKITINLYNGRDIFHGMKLFFRKCDVACTLH